jgi:hypothetical protein
MKKNQSVSKRCQDENKTPAFISNHYGGYPSRLGIKTVTSASFRRTPARIHDLQRDLPAAGNAVEKGLNEGPGP